MKLSLVVPCYNEADNVALFQQAVISAFDGCGYDYEIVFIDDGSRDATLHNLKKLYAAQQCPVKVVSFSRNFGKEAGIYAGLQHAAGDYICLIDADLQQRPEIVRDMVKILDEEPEFDVVAAFQDRRGEGKVLSFFKKCFYSIINKLSKVTLQPDASDFRTFRRSVRDSILELAEYHRFSKGIFAWVGYSTKFIPYTACERATGTTKWSFWKLVNYAIEGIIGFSTAPPAAGDVARRRDGRCGCHLPDRGGAAKADSGHRRSRLRHHHRADFAAGQRAAVLHRHHRRICGQNL